MRISKILDRGSDSHSNKNTTAKMRVHNSRKSSSISIGLIWIIVSINSLAVFVSAELTDIVKTTTGPVRGEILSSVNSLRYAAFKGIPYAKPPLGYLRFKPPVPIDPWTEILKTITDGNDCMQPYVYNDLINPKSLETSEDCLFINVYTPTTDLGETPVELKSVMVWIHGGGFLIGSSSSKRYRPDYLLEKGVVYVAFNYRLGPLGFLSLDHANATGNAGLKDQVLALKWVKANIEKFGGNPNNITLFGSSAGAASVGYHILSDASTGLFQAAICMSGTPFTSWSFHNSLWMRSQALILGYNLGATTTNNEKLLRALYNATAKEIVRASKPSDLFWMLSAFGPTLENESIATDVFLTTDAVDKRTKSANISQMLGFADHEMISFAAHVMPTIFIGLMDGFIEQGSVKFFKKPINTYQKEVASHSDRKPVYYYHISFVTDRSLHNIGTGSDLLGAGHGDDVLYIFYVPEANYSTDPTDPVRLTIDRVTTMWTNFAKYGNPTPSWVHDNDINITWPDSGPIGYCLNIGTELKVESRPKF